MVFELKTWTLSFRDRLEKQHVRRCHLCNFPPCTFRFASNVGFLLFNLDINKQGVPGMITGLAPTKTPVIHL